MYATPPIVTVIVSGKRYPSNASNVALYSVPPVTVVLPVATKLVSLGNVTVYEPGVTVTVTLLKVTADGSLISTPVKSTLKLTVLPL